MGTQDLINGMVQGNITTLSGIALDAVSKTQAQVDALNEILGEQRPPILQAIALSTPNFSGIGDAPVASINTADATTMINKFVPKYSLPSAPTNTFQYSEQTYVDSLLTAVQAKILNIVQNGWTSTAPEDQIWARFYERLAQAANDAIDLKLTTWASRGWTLPSGMANSQLGAIIIERLNAMLDASREIMIKQADLTDQNDNRYTEHALAYEAMMIQHFENVANRAIAVQRTALELSIAIYNANISAFSASLRVPEMLIDLLKMNVEVFSSEVSKYSTTANLIIGEQRLDFDIAKENLSIAIANFNTDVTAFVALAGAKIKGSTDNVVALSSMANAALGALHSVIQLDAQSIYQG